MGILNITPDSFSDGGDFLDAEKAAEQAKTMIQAGADIIDIGAESSGPDSKDVPEAEEWNRLEPVLMALAQENIPVSVDTWKSGIVKKALEQCVDMINDVTAFRGDPKILDVLADSDCRIVIMYSKDQNARTTLRKQEYADPTQEIGDFLEDRISFAKKRGIDSDRIILDPGMGAFLSSDPEVSFTVLRELKRLKERFPKNNILIGTSRKSFLGSVSDSKNPKNRLIASVTSAMLAAQNGANILRVHDVKETKEAVNTFEKIYPERIFLGLGSNLGDKEKNIMDATREIQKIAAVKKVSKIYQTKPWGKIDQPNFANAVIEIETDFEPENFLEKLQKIELKLGRKQREKWSEREIDIDILFWGERNIQTENLIIPHPFWHEREFVLEPMREIAPDFLEDQ